MAEGSVTGRSSQLGPNIKEQLLRLAKKRGVNIVLSSPGVGQLGAQPVRFSSVNGEASCIAIIPAKATPEEELRIWAREIAYVIARVEESKDISAVSVTEEEQETAAERILESAASAALKRVTKL